MDSSIFLAIGTVNIILLVVVIILVMKKSKSDSTFSLADMLAVKNDIADIKGNQGIINTSVSTAKSDIISEVKSTRQEIVTGIQANTQANVNTIRENIKELGEMLALTQKETSGFQDKRLEELNKQLTSRFDTLEKTVESRLTAIQENNSKKLDEMRGIVDEKLQKTLEEKIGQSFKMVSERLEQVHKGLGEMQVLATGVGDLKKVLSNVKTRGVLGEIQLGAILEEILPREQYDTNVATKKGSQANVEYAIKLPGDTDGTVYLPIDAKFPIEAYEKLLDAYENANADEVKSAWKVLETTIKGFAKTIHDKYIDPPHTTDFGIMFLPVEGLYAEVVRHGMVETLQREYKINIAGPTTMAALLNSLQMGFKTLAIQKHSGEVWNVLGAVKTEFDKFGDVIALTQQRLEQANGELDKLVGVRTRKIQSKLRSVSMLTDEQSVKLIDAGLEEAEEIDDLE